MDRASMIFCTASLVVSLGVAAALVPMASISTERLERSRVPSAAYEMDDVDLGEFGRVPVQDLVDYYMDNPPAPAGGEVASSKARFQGC